MPAPLRKPADGRRGFASPSPRTLPADRVIHRAARQSDSDPYEFIMATDDEDRIGDVIDIGGMNIATFKQNPIALWAHDSKSPIGSWEGLKKEGGRLIGKLKLAAAGTSPLIDRLRELIEQGILKAVSVGFRVIEYEPIDPAEPWGAWRFLKSELLECSLVSIPANSAALRIKQMPVRAASLQPIGSNPADAQIFSQPKAKDSTARIRPEAAPTRRNANQRQLASGRKETPKMPRTLAERITDAQTRSVSIDEEIQSIMDTAAEADDRELTAEELETIDALNEEKALVVKNIATLQGVETSMARKAVPANGAASARATVPAQAAKREMPGFMIGKLATVAALAFIEKQPPERIIAARYAHDDRVAACFDYVQRTATNIADTTTPGWAAEMVQEDVAAFIQDMENLSIFADLRARPSSMSLTGMNRVSVPRRSKGGLGGAWVGEAGVIPVLQGLIGATPLEPTKLAGITTFSRELMTATNSQIEAVLRNGLRIDTAEKLDKALLDALPRVAGVRPAGLLNGANSNASGGPDAASSDIKTAIDSIIQAGGGRDIVLIMNPSQLNGLAFAENALGMPQFPSVAQNQSLQGKPIISSLNVPLGTVVVMDAAEFASMADVPEFRVSEEATLTMANADTTPPTQAVDAAGAVGTADQVIPDGGILVAGGPDGAGTAGFQAMSMFQQWAVAVRLVMPVNWAMTKDDMVSVITGVDWGGA